MSDALDACWSILRRDGRAALIPYVTAGHPDPRATRDFLVAAGGAGADIIELGIPWSDPVADGPVIQASSHAALKAGMSVARVLELLAASAPAAPVVLFTYLNPVLAYGPACFAREAAQAGAAGLLVVDLPAGEDPETEADLGSSGLPLIRLIAPTTRGARLGAVAGASRAFVYLVSRLGVTGESVRPDDELARRVAEVRAVTSLPVAVGFGISSPAQAAAAARCADGVVVGSAVVRRMESGVNSALHWLADLRSALDRRNAA